MKITAPAPLPNPAVVPIEPYKPVTARPTKWAAHTCKNSIARGDALAMALAKAPASSTQRPSDLSIVGGKTAVVGRVRLRRPAGRAGRSRCARPARKPCFRACARQYICCPPLMLSVDPVTNPPSSEHRNATPRAISCAWPSRPTGIFATIFSSTSAGTAATMSVSI